ncbi:MAG: spore coat protein [Bacilli bacterium]|nr:spore coat protein [Bacilli bacterium]
MNDQITMDNYLLILKSTVEVYIHGTLESSNEDIKNLLKQGLDETINHQARTYNEMTKYGWYQINNVENNIIKQTLNKVNASN